MCGRQAGSPIHHHFLARSKYRVSPDKQQQHPKKGSNQKVREAGELKDGPRPVLNKNAVEDLIYNSGKDPKTITRKCGMKKIQVCENNNSESNDYLSCLHTSQFN